MRSIGLVAKGVFPFLVTVAGVAFVFGLVLVMNSEVERPKAKEPRAASAISISARPPKPRSPRPTERPKARRERTANRLDTPQPVMSTSLTSLAGVAMQLPGLEGDLLGEGSRKLQGGPGSARDLVMTEEAVDHPPRPLARPTPEYPPRARSLGISGFVSLSILIGSDGNVQGVKVLEASPSGVFEERAVEAVQHWQFEPATYKGERVKVWARQVVRFDLS